MAAGLSLCIQGTLLKSLKLAEIDRFIPVYTGNSLTSVATVVQTAVYPCVYREL